MALGREWSDGRRLPLQAGKRTNAPWGYLVEAGAETTRKESLEEVEGEALLAQNSGSREGVVRACKSALDLCSVRMGRRSRHEMEMRATQQLS